MARNKSASELAFDQARGDYLDAMSNHRSRSHKLRKRLKTAEATVAFELLRNSEAFEHHCRFRNNALVFFFIQWVVFSAIIGILVMN